MKSEADKMLERAQATAERNRADGIEPRPQAWQPLEMTRVIINGVPRETHRQLQELAGRSKSSLSRLGLLALEQLLIQSQGGTLPLLPHGQFAGTGESDRSDAS
jgi:hypothetical protein